MQKFIELPFIYVYDRTLAANASLLNQGVPVDPYGEFEMRAVNLGCTAPSAAPFTIQIKDANQIYLSNLPMRNQNVSGPVFGQPAMFDPPVLYPAGGMLLFDLLELLGVGNVLQLGFIGMKRLRVGEGCKYPGEMVSGIIGEQRGAFSLSPLGYVYDVNLTASQALPGQAVAVDTDSEFVMTGIRQVLGGAISVRVQDANGIYLANDDVRMDLNYIATSNQPFVFDPPVVYPPGSRLGFDITDVSGEPNAPQLIFYGYKRLAKRSEVCS